MSTKEERQELIHELYSSMPRSFISNLESTERGFGRVLSYLERSDNGMLSGDLAKSLNVSTSRIAGLLKRMEQSELITRQSSSDDARCTIVKITPKGVEMINIMREQVHNKVEILLEQISREELDTYIKISHKIRRIMED